MEEKKISGGGRMVGSKVSQIATIFQSMAPVKTVADGDVLMVSSAELPKPAETGVTVVRTESHVARFNNARALFEKLGSGDEPKAKSKVPDVRSRSSSTTSSLGGDSPNRATQDPSPVQMVRTSNGVMKANGTHENIVLNNDNYAFIKQSSVKSKDTLISAKVGGARSVDSAMRKSSPVVPRTIANGVTVVEKPAKPEKPERRLNNRELIEKQKNWTSHFSKTRTSSRYNSDPNKPAEQTTIASVVSLNKSSSFNLPRTARSPPPQHPSTPPPPPPTTSGLKAETPPISPLPSPSTPPAVSPRFTTTTPPAITIVTPVNTVLLETVPQVDLSPTPNSSGRGVEEKRLREDEAEVGESSDLKRHKMVASVTLLIEAEKNHTTTLQYTTPPVPDVSPSDAPVVPDYKFSPEEIEGVYRFEPATVTISTLEEHNRQLSPREKEAEDLLKKLDELRLTKPVIFHFQDNNSSVGPNHMCSSSVSEEDSGFLSSETAITKFNSNPVLDPEELACPQHPNDQDIQTPSSIAPDIQLPATSTSDRPRNIKHKTTYENVTGCFTPFSKKSRYSENYLCEVKRKSGSLNVNHLKSTFEKGPLKSSVLQENVCGRVRSLSNRFDRLATSSDKSNIDGQVRSLSKKFDKLVSSEFSKENMAGKVRLFSKKFDKIKTTNIYGKEN